MFSFVLRGIPPPVLSPPLAPSATRPVSASKQGAGQKFWTSAKGYGAGHLEIYSGGERTSDIGEAL